MNNNLKNRLSNRIRQEYSLTEQAALSKAEQLLKNCPPELRQNLQEYACEQPLSDVQIRQYTLPMILSIWGSPDFLSAFDVLCEYINGNQDLAMRRIWRTRK